MTIQIEVGASDVNKTALLYQSILENGTLTASSEAADGDVDNAAGDETNDFWTPAVVPANMHVDYGSAVECDTIGITAHNAGTNGSTLTLETSTDDSTWTERAVMEPLTDDTILVIFPSVTAQYWRVVMSGAVCSLGVVKIGKRLVMPSGPLSGHVAVNHAKRVEMMTNTSIKGQFLKSRIIRIGADLDLNFGLVGTDFVDNDMIDFESHFDNGRTFFYIGNPVKYPLDNGYCWRSGDEMRPSYEEGGILMNVSFEVSAYVE